MLRLTVGTMIALTAAQVLGVDPQVRALRPQPAWVEWGALLTGVLAFAVLFRAARRAYPLGMGAAIVGYLIPRIVGGTIGRAHVRTPVTNSHLVWRILLEKNNHGNHNSCNTCDCAPRL